MSKIGPEAAWRLALTGLKMGRSRSRGVKNEICSSSIKHLYLFRLTTAADGDTMKLPHDSVRGRIRAWLEKHADKLGDDVLEVGGRIHDPAAWYLNNRYLANGHWTVVDLQAGDNVDLVADVCNAAHVYTLGAKPFTGIVCSEVLEHMERPWVAAKHMFEILRPGGWIVITVPFGFHIHAYPSDYCRFTAEGLRVILTDAGFTDYEYEYGGSNVLDIKNDDGPAFQKRIEMQLFAVARRPE